MALQCPQAQPNIRSLPPPFSTTQSQLPGWYCAPIRIPAAPVNDLGHALSDPQALARHMVVEVPLDGGGKAEGALLRGDIGQVFITHGFELFEAGTAEQVFAAEIGLGLHRGDDGRGVALSRDVDQHDSLTQY